MNAEQFTYWLKGYLESSETQRLTQEQVITIKNKLQTVFTKVTISTIVNNVDDVTQKIFIKEFKTNSINNMIPYEEESILEDRRLC